MFNKNRHWQIFTLFLFSKKIQESIVRINVFRKLYLPCLSTILTKFWVDVKLGNTQKGEVRLVPSSHDTTLALIFKFLVSLMSSPTRDTHQRQISCGSALVSYRRRGICELFKGARQEVDVSPMPQRYLACWISGMNRQLLRRANESARDAMRGNLGEAQSM